MKVKVVIQEVQITEKTYEIDGVNSLETAGKCAMRARHNQFQPNAWLARTVPYPPTISVKSYEVMEC